MAQLNTQTQQLEHERGVAPLWMAGWRPVQLANELADYGHPIARQSIERWKYVPAQHLRAVSAGIPLDDLVP